MPGHPPHRRRKAPRAPQVRLPRARPGPQRARCRLRRARRPVRPQRAAQAPGEVHLLRPRLQPVWGAPARDAVQGEARVCDDEVRRWWWWWRGTDAGGDGGVPARGAAAQQRRRGCVHVSFASFALRGGADLCLYCERRLERRGRRRRRRHRDARWPATDGRTTRRRRRFVRRLGRLDGHPFAAWPATTSTGQCASLSLSLTRLFSAVPAS